MTRVPVIACDLDGTLASYSTWRGIAHIGDPIEGTLRRVKAALERGWRVEIFTARVAFDAWREDGESVEDARRHIEAWCEKHIGCRLPVTAVKSGKFDEFWDDRAVSVSMNSARGIDAFTHRMSLWEELR